MKYAKQKIQIYNRKINCQIKQQSNNYKVYILMLCSWLLAVHGKNMTNRE